MLKDTLLPKLIVALFATVMYFFVLPDLIEQQSDVWIFIATALVFFAWAPTIAEIMISREEDTYIIHKMKNGTYILYKNTAFFEKPHIYDSLEDAVFAFDTMSIDTTKFRNLKIFV